MKKLSIIGGAGGLVATMGFHLGLMGIFETIVLVDIKENMVKSHEMDMSQALSEQTQTNIVAGSWADMADSDLVIMTAAVPAAKVKSRNEFLQVNLKIVKAAAEQIKEYCPEAVVLTATAPIDIYNYVFHRIIGGDKRRFIGFCRNDSLRLRWAAAKVLGVKTIDVEGLVLGEHGETQVPIYGSLKVHGYPAQLAADKIAEIDATVKNWFTEFQALDSGRTSSWTSSTSIGFVVNNMALGGALGVMTGSAILDGEYGQSQVSLGVPLVYGFNGWDKIVEIELTPNERKALEASAVHLKTLIAQCEL